MENFGLRCNFSVTSFNTNEVVYNLVRSLVFTNASVLCYYSNLDHDNTLAIMLNLIQ